MIVYLAAQHVGGDAWWCYAVGDRPDGLAEAPDHRVAEVPIEVAQKALYVLGTFQGNAFAPGDRIAHSCEAAIALANPQPEAASLVAVVERQAAEIARLRECLHHLEREEERDR